jgi:hypothetical protein
MESYADVGADEQELIGFKLRCGGFTERASPSTDADRPTAKARL